MQFARIRARGLRINPIFVVRRAQQTKRRAKLSTMLVSLTFRERERALAYVLKINVAFFRESNKSQ